MIDRAPSPFDHDALLAQCLGDTDLARELCLTFAEKVENDVSELKRSFDQGDTEALARGAHKLNGVAGNLAAQAIQQLAERLECVAKTEPLPHAANELAQIEQAATLYRAGVHLWQQEQQTP